MKNLFKRILIVSKITGESALMALSSIRNDKFRTILSLTGISIGIFSIVAVFIAVNAMKANITEGLSAFGGNTVYIEQWPFSPEEGETEYNWWEYRLRPEITETEFNFLRRNSTTSADITYMSTFSALMKNGGNSFSDGYVLAASSGFDALASIEISEGRYFSYSESKNGSNVAVIGYEVATAVFGETSEAIGKEMKINGVPSQVIGVMKKEGTSMVSVFNKDAAAIIPLNFGKTMYDVTHHGGAIIAAPKQGVRESEFQGELKKLMRSYRRLRPSQKDNFAINSMTFLINELDKLTGTVEKVGWIIACFSLLIGGFGIANIMFVSVKERTGQIGIQKALGAPRYVILTQFLVEAAILAIAGGSGGIFIAFILSGLIHPDGFNLVMTLPDVVKGISISVIIGLLSGFIPSYTASRLNPVDAING